MIRLLLPERCLACRGRADMPFCDRCRADVRLLPPGCPRCGAPPSAGHGCWPSDAPVTATFTAYDYRGPVRAAVVAAKLGGARRGWAPLAAPLAERLSRMDLAVDAVTWVTSVPARVRQRGTDHARAIAEVVAGALDVPLVRLLDVGPGRVHEEHYRATLELPGSDVVLVDDVLTTGATAWRAAAALKRAGAGDVILVTLARAGGHPLGAVGPRP
jgi:predicted amidophosphoribosyltransferase